MNKYETVVILNYKINLKTFTKILDNIKGITEQKVKIIEDIGIRKLAYTLSGQKSGYYMILKWTGTHFQVQKLEEYFRQEDKVLKFATVKLDD